MADVAVVVVIFFLFKSDISRETSGREEPASIQPDAQAGGVQAGDAADGTGDA